MKSTDILTAWDTFKTGTVIVTVVGGVGLLLAGLAFAIQGHMGWFEYGTFAFGIITYIVMKVRSRYATAKVEQKLDAALNLPPKK